ncbi:MAG: hypothetical protein ACOYOU_21690 [Kiritimatiellia bacterium]
MNATMLVKEIRRLPDAEQREIFDFVGFLCSRRGLRAASVEKRGIPSKAPFVGMWSKRVDMADSTAWVRNQRRTMWGAHG